MRFSVRSVLEFCELLLPLALTMPPSKVRPQCVKLCTNKAANMSFEPKEEESIRSGVSRGGALGAPAPPLRHRFNVQTWPSMLATQH